MQPIDYTPYIQGDKNLNDLPCMNPLNYCLGPNSRIRLIKDISLEIQGMLKVERNKEGPYLVKKAFYATATVSLCLMMGVVIELGLAWARLTPIRFTTNTAAQVCFGIFSSMSLFFHLKDNTIKEQVKIIYYNKYKDEAESLRTWHQALHSHKQSLKALYQESFKQRYKNIITEASFETINSFIYQFNKKIKPIHELPDEVREILFPRVIATKM